MGQQNESKQDGEKVMDATRHVGKTLEAEGNFADVMGTQLPLEKSTGTEQHATAGHPGADPGESLDALDVRTVGEDRSFQASTNREDQRRADGVEVSPLNPDGASLHTLADRLGEVPETLHTRLPGDTSSDPHTDLGPDNATNLQRRAG